MALPTSGPLSLANIQTEFGGANPISLSEYYAGGSLVPAGTTGTNGAVPSSGTISIANFYGTSALPPVWTPAGGSSAGTPTELSVYSILAFGDDAPQQIINCNQSTTWTYTSTGSPGFSVSEVDGGGVFSITFSLAYQVGTVRTRVITLNSTVAGVTQYWSITLTADGS